MHTDKAIAEFEAAFVAGMVEEFGEGYRSSAEHMLTDGSVIAKYAKWAWFASRRELVVQLPDDGIDDCREAWPGRCRDTFDCGYNFASWRHEQAIEAAGVTVRG